eukprot:7469355-Ditylum_brightwellii.AAC.1
MPLAGCSQLWEALSDICRCQARPCYKETLVDGIYPCGWYWTSHCFMEELHLLSNYCCFKHGVGCRCCIFQLSLPQAVGM